MANHLIFSRNSNNSPLSPERIAQLAPAVYSTTKADHLTDRYVSLSTSEIMTVVPFEFGMKPMAYLLYSRNRGVLNALRIPDKALEQYLNFGSTGWVNYIQYQGDMTETQIEACQWQTASASGSMG